MIDLQRDLEDLERWIVLHIDDLTREEDPEVREAVNDLDVLFLQWASGEVTEWDIWQAILRWHRRLSTVVATVTVEDRGRTFHYSLPTDHPAGGILIGR